MSVSTILQRLSTSVKFHLTSILLMLRVPSVLIWLYPFLVGAVVWMLSTTPLALPFSKPYQEVFAVTILIINLIIMTIVHMKMRQSLTLWLLLLGVALLCRELHFYGTHRGFYIALILLVGWYAVKRVQLAGGIKTTGGGKLLVGAMWTYAMSKVMDRNYLDFLPEYSRWANHVEESMESSGHLLILSTSIVILLFWRKQNNKL